MSTKGIYLKKDLTSFSKRFIKKLPMANPRHLKKENTSIMKTFE